MMAAPQYEINSYAYVAYIASLSDLIKRRFSDKTAKLSNCLSIFEPNTVVGGDDGCVFQLLNLVAFCKDLSTAATGRL